MTQKTAYIIAFAGVVIAGVIGYFIYKSSKTVADASNTAASAGGTALGNSIIQGVNEDIKSLFGGNNG